MLPESRDYFGLLGDGVKSSVFTVRGFITNSLKLKGNKGGGYEKLSLMID